MNVSRETEERLATYRTMVEKWNARINLVSASTIPSLRARHIDDCAQIIDHSGPVKGRWVDLGSGGGFPGIVVAILTADWELNVTLVESDQRKSAFLRAVLRETGLTKASVISDRIESVPPLEADHVSARALAPLASLLPMVERHMQPQGQAWLMKGQAWRQECEAAKNDWRFDLRAIPSRTDPEAAILNITGVSHA
ncbi:MULTISPECIES: 16S rRNA (guanine(527)-N(7))-methyltransferase RsmG [Paracoccus]|uniref:16S rRNA (guanine(527)-N(7))-methyltransferase RsmG n=1 Tax=Paracoccus TaxID=265 RepID=UPI0023F129B8|nr:MULTISPECIES: 16S rRNA (guanine(527)-N(7))-methyltransferase RsmG [Paracoccus]